MARVQEMQTLKEYLITTYAFVVANRNRQRQSFRMKCVSRRREIDLQQGESHTWYVADHLTC